VNSQLLVSNCLSALEYVSRKTVLIHTNGFTVSSMPSFMRFHFLFMFVSSLVRSVLLYALKIVLFCSCTALLQQSSWSRFGAAIARLEAINKDNEVVPWAGTSSLTSSPLETAFVVKPRESEVCAWNRDEVDISIIQVLYQVAAHKISNKCRYEVVITCVPSL
jgi:hypothetical protein